MSIWLNGLLFCAPPLCPHPSDPPPPLTPPRNLFKFVMVLLSASVERVGVSHMRDFLYVNSSLLSHCATNSSGSSMHLVLPPGDVAQKVIIMMSTITPSAVDGNYPHQEHLQEVHGQPATNGYHRYWWWSRLLPILLAGA